MSGSHYLEIPARAGSPSAIGSSKLSLCTGNCPEKVIVLSSLEGELHDDAFISHAHRRYWNPWGARENVQLIQKIWDWLQIKPMFSLLLTAPSLLTLGRGWANPGVKWMYHQIRPSAVANMSVSQRAWTKDGSSVMHLALGSFWVCLSYGSCKLCLQGDAKSEGCRTWRLQNQRKHWGEGGGRQKDYQLETLFSIIK